jgi:hypothetical protein
MPDTFPCFAASHGSSSVAFVKNLFFGFEISLFCLVLFCFVVFCIWFGDVFRHF